MVLLCSESFTPISFNNGANLKKNIAEEFWSIWHQVLRSQRKSFCCKTPNENLDRKLAEMPHSGISLFLKYRLMTRDEMRPTPKVVGIKLPLKINSERKLPKTLAAWVSMAKNIFVKNKDQYFRKKILVTDALKVQG